MASSPKRSGNWYVRADNDVQGPFSVAALRAAAAAGQVRPESLVKQGVEGDWIPASRLKGLFREPADARSRADVAATADRFQNALRQSLRSETERTCPFCKKVASTWYCTDCRRFVFEPLLLKWGIPSVLIPLLLVLGSLRPWDAMTDHPEWLGGAADYSISRWILYGIAAAFGVGWFLYYYGTVAAALVWSAATPIVRPVTALVRPLAAPVGKIARAMKAPLTVSRSGRGLLCECERCQTRYVVGTNAVAVTFQQALAAIEGGGSTLILGGPISPVPDKIGMIVGQKSWPSGTRVQPDPDVIPDEIAAAWQTGQIRRWVCDKCKTEQQYRWPAT